MKRFKIGPVLVLASIIFMLIASATAQGQPEGGIFFSTEEDFFTRGPVSPDGNPLISDGDLLNSTGYVYMRNRTLLEKWEVREDLGLDAADIIDIEDHFVAFSTELDHPKGLFTAGDLLTTNGAILPNSALLAAFDVPDDLDLGLDAVHFLGEQEAIIEFLKVVREEGREYWLREPKEVVENLERLGIDIWFSTEGSPPREEKLMFLDGDLLSAADGTIVGPNAELLPPSVPAGIPTRGVDFGLDAYTATTRDYKNARKFAGFSTEILFKGEPRFTDGDVLEFGNGVATYNEELLKPFEPKAGFLGLDALSRP